MYLLQVAYTLRIGSRMFGPLPPWSPLLCALVVDPVLLLIPPFPLAAVPLFLCPKGTMSLLLTPRNDKATPPQR